MKNLFSYATHTVRHMSVTRKTAYAVAIVAAIMLWGHLYSCKVTQICEPALIEPFFRKSAVVMLPKTVITAELVDKERTREKGLSGRSSLKAGTGMLFSFGIPGKYGFWMKDMHFPLDILWINDKGVVVYIAENVKPEDYPKTYINEAPASFVLELPVGSVQGEQIYLGTKVRILIER